MRRPTSGGRASPPERHRGDPGSPGGARSASGRGCRMLATLLAAGPAGAVEVTFPLTIDYGVAARRRAEAPRRGERRRARALADRRRLRHVRRPRSRPGARRQAAPDERPRHGDRRACPSWAGASRPSAGAGRRRSWRDPSSATTGSSASGTSTSSSTTPRASRRTSRRDSGPWSGTGARPSSRRSATISGRPSRRSGACSGRSARPPAASPWRSRPSDRASWRSSRTPCGSAWPSTCLRCRRSPPLPSAR